MQKKVEQKEVNKSTNKNISERKLKLLFTIVNRNKAEFFMDLIQSSKANMQLVTMATGTATQDILTELGIKNNEKAVIISVIRADRESEVLRRINDRFNAIKGAKGIAFTISLSSVIGVNIFKFLSNYGMEE